MGSEKVNDSVLDEFIAIQSQIEQFEKQGIFDGLKLVEEEFETVEKSKRQAEINNKVLTEQTKKEKQDLDNISQLTVTNFFKNKEAYDTAVSKEQQEYLHSVNMLEISTNELKTAQQQFASAKAQLDNYKKENEKALELYNRQMNILFSTFEGDFGSDLENQLEKQTQTLGESKDQLRSALHKWSNARFLLVYAYNQIQASEQSWEELVQLDQNNPQKVIFATEVRNNLIAANQNLQNTRSYLKNIELPYCTEDDLKTLKNVAAGTYQDMMVEARQKYVLNILQVLRKRCAALNQWFDQVIKSTLVVDFSRVKIDYDVKSRELKLERIRLLQEKIKDKTGKDIKVNLFDIEASGKEKEDLTLPAPDNTTGGSDISEKPLTSYDLPPPPSRDQILGNVKKIEEQYRQQTNDWNKHLDSSKKDADDKLNQMLAQYETAE